jgi:hypothetical protein
VYIVYVYNVYEYVCKQFFSCAIDCDAHRSPLLLNNHIQTIQYRQFKRKHRIMGKKQAKKKSGGIPIFAGGDGDGVMVDPSRVRYQHARIRPIFSGCGRRVEDTLEEIRQGKMKPSDLPPIQVLLGPMDPKTGEPWYFSLNNRRLWVLKRCRDEGLLPNNQILARVRKPKSDQEALRYSLENCVLEAKFMAEKPRVGNLSSDKEDSGDHGMQEKDAVAGLKNRKVDSVHDAKSRETLLGLNRESSGEDTDDSDDDQVGPSNRFSALF